MTEKTSRHEGGRPVLYLCTPGLYSYDICFFIPVGNNISKVRVDACLDAFKNLFQSCLGLET